MGWSLSKQGTFQKARESDCRKHQSDGQNNLLLLLERTVKSSKITSGVESGNSVSGMPVIPHAQIGLGK